MIWTSEKLDILRSNVGRLGAPQIGELVGCTGQTIRNKMHDMGLKYIRVPRTWTLERIEILKANVGKLSGPEIGKLVGCSGQAVRDKMHELGIRCNPSVSYNQWTPEQVEVLKAHAGKLSCPEIGKLVGKSRGSVCVKIRALGLTGIAKNNPNVWTVEMLEKLKLLSSGTTLLQLSREIGIGETRISMKAKQLGIKIMRGDWWRNDEDSLLYQLAGSMTAKEIGLRLGRSRSSVHTRAYRLNINLTGAGARPKPKPRGPRRKSIPRPQVKPVKSVERSIDICPKHQCPVSNWQEHRERLGCDAMPSHLAAFFQANERRLSA